MLCQVALVILAFVTTLNNAQLEQHQTIITMEDNGEEEITLTFGPSSTTPSSPQVELVNHHEKRNGTSGKELVTVVVIGSGMAGITAARHLADNTDFDIVVLEANTDRYGGRAWSYEAPGHPGQPVELGAMWIHGGVDNDHPLNKLVNLYGLATMQHDVGESGEIEIYDLLGKKYNEENMKEIASVPHLLDELRQQTIDTNAPDMNYDTAFKILASKNPRLFQQNRVRFFEIPGLESYQGSTKEQISLIYSEGIPNSTSVDFHGHDVILPSGYVRLIDLLITNGRPFHIELGRQVTDIKCDDASYPVQVTSVDLKSKEKHIYTADHVIVAVPLGVLKQAQIRFAPPLPTRMLTAIDKIGFGNMVKVLLVYDEPFWPDMKYIGVESIDPTGLPLFFVNLYKINKLPALLASICSQGAVLADKLSENDLIQRVVAHLEIILGAKTVQNRNLVHTKVTRWRNDPLIRGAYSFGKLGMTSDDAYNVRTPLKPYLFFAGEHTTFPEAFQGSMHGAHVSGIRAAREVMQQRGLPIQSAAVRINWLGKLKTAAILSQLILYR